MAARSAPRCDLESIPLRHPAAARVVAIGDLHGDVHVARAALRLAGVIDDTDMWIGGDTVVVQTGDLLDRGDDEPELLALLDGLPIVRLNGNHELMNAAGDLRYVTPGGLSDYGGADARAAAFRPGSPRARGFARFNLVAIVGDTVFAHGGVLPEHTGELEALNREARCWLAGQSDQLPTALTSKRSPIWTRDYGRAPEQCDALDTTLQALGVSRMVIGHTVQPEGVTSACDGRVWRIDVGLSVHYGGPLEILEISPAAGGRPRVLRGTR